MTIMIGDRVYHRSSGRHFIGQVVHKRSAGKRLLIKWEDGSTREHEGWAILKCPKNWNK